MTAPLAFLVGFFPPLSLGAANAAFALFLLAAAVEARNGKEAFRLERTAFDAPVIFFLAAWALAALFGLDPAKSAGKWGGQLRLLVFYALTWTSAGRHKPAALKGYLWGAGLAAGWGLIQAAVGTPAPADNWPAWLVWLDGGGRHYFTLRDGRAHGFVHPLTFAELLLPFFFFGLARLLESEGRKALLQNALWATGAGAALLLTLSRGPWLAAAAGAAVLLAAHPRRWRLLPLLLAAAAVGSAAPAVRERVASILSADRDASGGHRLVLWNNAWQTARRDLLTGAGPRCLERAVKERQGEPGFRPNPQGKDGDAHNQYLQHLAERGLPGLAALLWLLAAPLWLAAKALRGPPGETPRWVLWGLAAFFAAFPVANITERAFDDAEPAVVFWTMAAMLPAAVKEKR